MENINNFEIGIRIRQQRELLGLSRERLAEYLDVSAKFVSDIELGIKGMSINTLIKLSYILKITTDYILLGKKEKTDINPLLESYLNCSKEKIEYADRLLKLFIEATI